jgi:hypothetical protein
LETSVVFGIWVYLPSGEADKPAGSGSSQARNVRQF